jgi:hypothetical protein
MKNLLLLCLLGSGLAYLSGCQLRSKSLAEGWTAEVQAYSRRYCVDNQQCADINIQLLQFKGEQSATLGAFNEKIQRHLLVLVEAPAEVPIEAALDSVAENYFKVYSEFKSTDKTPTENWIMSLTAAAPVLTPQITTIEARQFYKVFINKKTELLHVITYDFRTEKYLSVSDLIADTAALRPMLEMAFCQKRQLKSPAEITPLLQPNLDKLPMPRYAAVYPEGIRMVYNAQEYALDQEIPITDIMFSWQQLSGLADKTKWLE